MFKSSNLNIQKNVPLAPLNTFRIGGKARFFVSVKSPGEIINAVQWAKKNKVDFKVFSGGSNVLFPDEDLDCLAIRIFGGVVKIKENQITVDAGVPLPNLIKKSISVGLAGLERLAGIPGTVGGAIVGNSGAFGHSISEVVDQVEIWDGKKKRWLNKKNCCFNYRDSLFKGKSYLVLKAILSFNKKDTQILEEIYQETLEERKRKWKPDILCPGCFFKNVLVKNVSEKSLSLIDHSKIIDGKIPTGYLLEKVGAKGMKIGNIKVADFHANFLINEGNGKAKDVKKLAKILKERVKKKFAIELEEEVRYF